MNKSKKGMTEFVIARGNTSKVFEGNTAKVTLGGHQCSPGLFIYAASMNFGGQATPRAA